ncbi:6826_t:CDS:2 [Funneliformis mosseae]|uniref:Inositol-pentakisphosphate 2-kinase n=1 Tax=Funneliformis mosseae TaxID=27381 RepID=A0A9N9EE13_FUNMO|nr:6826_t:CDS:2 [Funneliformis mosseae]
MARIETIHELYNATLWDFKAEGNANIILSYNGENDIFSAVVLRLRKDNEIKFDTSVDPQFFTTSYVNFVMMPLLGSKYVGESILLEVRPEFLKALSRAILPLRSKKRIQNDIDFKQRYGMLTPNHTRFSVNINPTISVELKPKWAFLPSSSFINCDNSVKLQSCRFCMHKYLNKDKRNPTRYCPLDLFSLEDKRVRKAIESLINDPGSNLKLFIQGTQIEIGKENWQTRLYEFFEIDCPMLDDRKQKSNRVVDMLISLLIQAIMKEQDLFIKLKRLQKTLDELDIEGIDQILLTHQPKLSEPSLEEWKLIVNEYKKRTTFEITNMDDKQIRQRIYEYLISATLKDCSIIFAFQKSDYNGLGINNKQGVAELQSQFYNYSSIFPERLQQISLTETQSAIYHNYNGSYKHYIYKVNVIDLDPKPLAKLHYYKKLDTEI